MREIQLDLLAVVQIDGYSSSSNQFSEQQLVGQCLADQILDQARHRSGSHERIKAFLRQDLAQLVGEEDLDLFLLQLLLKLHQELVDDAQNDVLIQ